MPWLFWSASLSQQLRLSNGFTLTHPIWVESSHLTTIFKSKCLAWKAGSNTDVQVHSTEHLHTHSWHPLYFLKIYQRHGSSLKLTVHESLQSQQEALNISVCLIKRVCERPDSVQHSCRVCISRFPKPSPQSIQLLLCCFYGLLQLLFLLPCS